MKKSFSKNNITIIASIVMAVMLTTIAFAGFTTNNRIDISKVSSTWASEQASVENVYEKYTQNYLANTDKSFAVLYTYDDTYSGEKLLEESSLVVRGTVIGFDYLTIQSANGASEEVFTDYYIDVSETLRGTAETDNDGLIRVRAMGGENSEAIVINNSFALEIGEEYLLFLAKPTTGGGFNTNEDGYYYTVGGSSGALLGSRTTVQAQNNTIASQSYTPIQGIESTGELVEYNQFVSELQEYNAEYAVDEDALLNSNMEGLDTNLDSGFISQAEYNEAIEDMENYATIVNK